MMRTKLVLQVTVDGLLGADIVNTKKRITRAIEDVLPLRKFGAGTARLYVKTMSAHTRVLTGTKR